MKLTKTGVALVVLGGVAAQGLFFQWRFYSDRQRVISENATLGEARKSLESVVAQLEQQNEALRAQAKEHGLEPAAAAHVAPRTADPARLEALKQLGDLQTRYAALQASVTSLQNRVGELEGTVEKLNAENKRLASSESDLKDQLSSTQRVVQAMDSELKSKSDRVASLESQLRKMRDETSGADRRLAQVAAVAAELEDVNRRRENFLNSLNRRYRDVTEQLRALVLRMDTQRDNAGSFGASDVSRISSAVQSADDDLRQLASLNTQAQRIAAKLR